MAYVTFDTSAIISKKVTKLPKNFLLSAVVIAELTASANDDSVRKDHEATRERHEKEKTLIVPTAEDWTLASRVLFWLAQGCKRHAGGKSPQLIKGASQRMMLDALIAVSAQRAGATVVTDNYRDFKAIQYYHPVKVKRASEYFQGRA